VQGGRRWLWLYRGGSTAHRKQEVEADAANLDGGSSRWIPDGNREVRVDKQSELLL